MKIRKIDLKLTLLFFLLVEPPYFTIIPWINTLYDYGQYVLFFTLIFIIIMNHRTADYFMNPESYFVIFFIVLFISSAWNNKSAAFLQYVFGANKAAIIFLLLVIYEFKKNSLALLRCLRNLDIYLYINLLTILIFPSGLYKSGTYACWFLGYKNPQIRIILPILFFLIIYDYISCNCVSLRTIVATVCSILTIIITKSGTGVTGLLVFFLLLIIGVNLKNIYNSLFSFKAIVAVVAILVIMFVIYQIQYTSSFVSTIIVDFYGKSLDFSARTLIWKRAMELIGEHPILGFGYLDSAQYAKLFNFEWAVAHPHNYYLYLLLTGGIVLFGVFVMIVIYFSKSLKLYGYSKVTVCATAYIAAILVMGITESMTEFIMFYGTFLIAIESMKIEKQCKKIL